MGRTLVAGAIACAVMAAAGHARAGGDEAAAEALFGEAKKLAAQKKYAEACPKFAESNRLDRGAGTLIHLGDCYEKNKQTASAWATYKEAASAAQALGRKDWEKLASQRANALEPKLARLTIKVDKDNAAKLEVSRDGTTVSEASFGVPIPVDVGAHTVEASAPGHKPFSTSTTVSKDGETVEVSIPKLEAEPEPVAAEPAPTPEPALASPAKRDDDGSGQRTLGFILGGVGVAGLAAGAVTGLMAMGKSSDAKATCPNDGPCASRDAVDASESARTLGLVSTIAFVAGGVGLAAGAALVFTAPSEGERAAKAARVRVAPNAGPTGAGVTVLGVF
ncbi:MAG: hypothetical protein KF894_30195 [Labilithrix sp.]|nr:hypothetical protein [Labilithrix sp.]